MIGPQSRTIVGKLCLEDMGIVVERVHDDPPANRPEASDVPGRHGQVLRGLTLEPRTITLECRAFRKRWEDFERLKDELAPLLVEEELFVSVRTHPGEHYLAHLDSITEGDRIGGTGIGYLELAFTADDPIRYGARKTAAIASAGSTTVLVGGNMPAIVSLSSDAAVRGGNSTVWGIRADEADFMHVATGADTAKAVVIDGITRSVTVAGETKMLTLDSNWLTLKPGGHAVRMDEGTGAATLSWQERSV